MLEIERLEANVVLSSDGRDWLRFCINKWLARGCRPDYPELAAFSWLHSPLSLQPVSTDFHQIGHGMPIIFLVLSYYC